MSKTLVIVESPSKAQKIQEYLGKKYVVMASKGHITDLAKGGKHGIGIDIENKFKPKYVLMDDKVELLDALINAAKDCDNILVASDPDREGESIAWHLATRLEDVGKPIKRMVFNEIKKDKLLKAVKSVRDIDMNLFQAQEARRILDRLVGFIASPFLINFFGSNLSAGRVQSVVTRMIIDREREIEAFVPEEFWTINANISYDKEIFVTKYPYRITDAATANLTKDKLLKANDFFVSEVLAEEEKRGPAAPLVTSSLQQIMSKNHGFGADRTMKAAQSLYESGYCTYIRTDSVRVGDDALAEVRDWIQNNKYELPKKANTFKNKDASQDAHECIRPSDLSLVPGQNFAIIDPDEKLVYETIWKYFIASQMMPAVYNTLKVTIKSKSDSSLELKASGKALKSKGFLEVLGINDDSKIEIPNLKKGDIVQLSSDKPIKVEKKQTQPPARYSEDKLIKELVNKNIGRPATYADLLSKITSRNYVEKKGNVYHATELGKKITDILSQFFTFMDYNYTADMETQLDLIESGKVNKIDMLSIFYKTFTDEIRKAYSNYITDKHLCKKCNNYMIQKNGKYGKFYACVSVSCKYLENIESLTN
jgi:DNA topoisomerase-1